MGHERMSRGADESKLLLDWLFPLILTLFTPAYLSISKNEGGAQSHCAPPLNILGLGGVRVPILFGNYLPMND